MRMFLFNFLYALFNRLPSRTQLKCERTEAFLIDGCERHTPPGHRWANGPMF